MSVPRLVRRIAVLALAVALLVLTPTVSALAGQSSWPDHFERQPAALAIRITSADERQQPPGVRIAVAATLGQELGKRWNAFYRDWLRPARNVVLPWLAVLIVLLVLARLATAVVVATDAVAYKGWRLAIWWGGLLMLCAAAAVPVGVAYARGETKGFWKAGVDVGAFWLGIVTFVAGLCLAWALALARSTAGNRVPWKRPPWRWPLLAAVTFAVSVGAAVLFLVVGGLGWTITNLARATAGLWVLGLFLALAGVVWVAVGRGETLKLQVDVRKKDGTADPNTAHYLVARLQDLGSARPRGLEAPEQTDVTALPDTALKSLPGGSVTVAISNALQLVRSAIPWHATVSLVDDDTAVVTLARNGRVAEDTRRISRPQLVPQPPAAPKDASNSGKSEKSGDKANEDGTEAQAELLTAAAAFLMCALSRRHLELRHGLCGATNWESIARLAIATPPSKRQDDTTKERLLAAAVDADPGNLLAKVALLETRYRRAYDLKAYYKLTEGLNDHWKIIERQLPPVGHPNRELAKPDPGYGALQLRLLYSRAAVWLNVQLLQENSGQNGQAAWQQANAASCWLIYRLGQIGAGKDEDPKLNEFAADLRPTARYIWEGMVNRAEEGWKTSPDGAAEIDKIGELVKGWGKDGLKRTAHYARACSLASMRSAEKHRDVLADALDELEQAATRDDLRQAARADPSFAVFATLDPDDQLRRRYKELVGAPATDVLTLAPFTLHAERLRARGITTAADLERASIRDLARCLDIERSTVQRWQEIARLAEHPPGGGQLDTEILQLLLSLDINSSAKLAARLKNPQELYRQLVEKAIELKLIVPTWKETVGRWESRRHRW